MSNIRKIRSHRLFIVWDYSLLVKLVPYKKIDVFDRNLGLDWIGPGCYSVCALKWQFSHKNIRVSIHIGSEKRCLLPFAVCRNFQIWIPYRRRRRMACAKLGFAYGFIKNLLVTCVVVWSSILLRILLVGNFGKINFVGTSVTCICALKRGIILWIGFVREVIIYAKVCFMMNVVVLCFYLGFISRNSAVGQGVSIFIYMYFITSWMLFEYIWSELRIHYHYQYKER